ncbi:glycosyltransferase family 4 protein [Thermococcus aciditolerans]|uniref:Glycosyltransferase family 4 protein n=1 Tax=Thermococcus aciditolerans TaxID=2598455 RepID=A0A5C0SLT6_9EURY|nr:glycosyltransferase family 4 protein [Thermococcus aciditolerans]QEK14952.1 glycosyltransferase family 4 protein [Thermococcus aciditolerans]
MRVLMLTPEFYPVWGGLGTYALELSRAMPKDVELHIVTPKRENFGKSKINESPTAPNLPPNVFIHYIGTARDTFIYNFKFQINCSVYLWKFIERYDIDIVHGNGTATLFVNPSKLDVPIVNTIHSTIGDQIRTIKETDSKFSQLEFSEKMTLLLSPFLEPLERMHYIKNQYYITVSEFSKIRLVEEKKLRPANITVIYNGVDPTKFSPKREKEAKKYFPMLTDIEIPKVLYLSRFIEKKGISILLKAISSILKREDVHFVFAGPGKKPDFGKYKIPQQNYTFLGYINHEDTPFLYALSDIFVLPSLYENFPISILEAMASETTVLATKVGGIPEMITSGKDGILIPPKNKDELIKAIVELIENDPLRRKLSKNARKTVIKKFSWKQTAKKTKEYYESILEMR